MAQTKPKAGQFYGVSDNGTDGQFLKTDGTGGMSWDSPITNPTITSIDYPGTQTAADPAGGESVIINGTLFASGITCTVGGTSAVTAFNSATQITITTPAKAAGQYTVAVTNPNGGTASQANFIQYSGVPVWSTAAGTLGNVLEGTAASFQVTATEGSDTIEYAVTTGTLPTGLSLATATGAITGTAPTVSADTTTTFSITATDDENQTSSSRSFSITVQNDNPSNYFNTVLYTGNNGTQSITGVGFQPDFTWIKARDNGSNNHALTDSVRGTGSGNGLSSNTTGAEGQYSAAYGYLSAFGTDGFTVQAGSTSSNFVNSSSANYVAWNFKAGGAPTSTNSAGAGNVPTAGSVKIDGADSTTALAGATPATNISANTVAGFSIVKYTGPASNSTVGHGLGVSPSMIIQKPTGSGNWYVYIAPGIIDATSNYYYLVLNSTATKNTTSSAAPTTTTFNVAGSGAHIAYCFASMTGFSKVGTYSGNGNASGPIVQTGFEPAFLMIKNVDSTESGGASWLMYNNKRSPSNPRDRRLYADSSSSENQNSNYDINFLTNGFQIASYSSNYGYNNSGQTYLYLAFAADPSTTTPSLANSFATELYTGTGSGSKTVTGVGFRPDLVWGRSRTGSIGNILFDVVRGENKQLSSDNTSAQVTRSSAAYEFENDGFTVTTAGNLNNSVNYASWNWKAGGTPSINTGGTTTSLVSANQAAGFSIVQWVGTRPSSDTIGHGLGLTPKMIIIKNSSISSDWTVYVESEGATKHGILDTTSIWVSNAGAFNNTSPTSSVFTVGGDAYTNGTGNNIIAYCFADISGYSKVGSYVGTGGSHTVTTGFEPGFLMMKCSSNSAVGYWVILDSKRNTTNPRDKELFPNDSIAEYDGNRNVNFTSTGFELTSSSYNNNINETYIYLAIKEN